MKWIFQLRGWCWEVTDLLSVMVDLVGGMKLLIALRIATLRDETQEF